MNARDTIVAALRGAAGWGDTGRPERLAAEHRIENRNEAATWLTSYPFQPASTDWERGRNEGVAWSAGILRDPDPWRPDGDASGAPDFFQRGRTYTRGEGSLDGKSFQWVFEVRSVDAAPDGTRYAFGFLTSNAPNPWVPHSEWESNWLADEWTDITDTTTGGPHA